MPEFHRRDFLKIVGASAGAAAASGCSDPVQKLIPYVIQPEEITPGLPVYYASTCQECPAACGLHVKTREGRPIKLEGNPEHPINRGTLCARGQASIGRTYHPDRYKGPLFREDRSGPFSEISWDDAISKLALKVRDNASKTWLFGGQVGPTKSAWLDRIRDALGMGGRVVYEALAPEALREASRSLFGSPAEPTFDLSKADFILDLGSDFLEVGSPTEHQRQLAAARDADHQATRGTRVVSVGPRLGMTASNADEWLAAKASGLGTLAAALATEIGASGRVAELMPQASVQSAAEATGLSADDIKRIAGALRRAKNPVVLPPCPALTSRRGGGTAGAVLLLNAALGAVGKSVRFPAEAPATRLPHYDDALKLQDANLAVLLVHDTNPAYSLPGFADTMDKADFVVSFASMPDETSERANLVLPDHTPLESWDDAEPRVGIRSLVQPSLRPLYNTRAMIDTLIDAAKVIGANLPARSYKDLVGEAWSGTHFRKALGRGGVFGVAPQGSGAPVEDASQVALSDPLLEGDARSYTLVAAPSTAFYDGRSANLPWLQEFGDPVTKITWQSWAEVSLATAASLGLGYGDVIRVETDSRSAELPIVPRGGLRDDVVAIAMGQGHTVGSYASDKGASRGTNVFSLLPARTDENGGPAWLVAKADISATGTHRRLPFVQTSQNQRGRDLGKAVSLLELAKGHAQVDDHAEVLPTVSAGDEAHGDVHADESHGGGHAEHHAKPFVAMTDSSPDSPYRWGMAVDLDRCTGCSACITACYIENNIPVVGEESVIRGRYMAWLRIERWVGDGDNQGGMTLPMIPDEAPGAVDVRNAAMLCQQCGAAPCEPVCPVIATYHSDEGLNGMIYNRCIGTRYCANNCPYKVRRFNWYDFALENLPDPMQLMSNPDVTVRGQGVMEKCTFCVQRVAAARQTAKDEGRPIADGEVTTACAQTCGSGAITFGNLKDPESAVSKLGGDKARGYHALHDLNTRPAVTYLAKVTRGAVEG